ncbi:MAG: hypothetical protein HYU99_04895 [Deltaproteobacteria bacterium]|nr:hypothetical protein [Deltaproteobacteria bacterium]
MKDFLKNLGLAVFVILPLVAFVQCGGSDSGDDSGTGGSGATPEAGDSEAATGASAGLGTLAGGTGDSAVGSENVAEAVKAVIRGRIKQQTIEIDEEFEIACTVDGTITNAATGTVTVNDTTFEIDLTGTATFEECTESASVTLDDGSTCDFDVVMDGTATCDISGSGTESSLEMTIDCSTDEDCSGITLTVNGEEHTLGFSMSGTMSSDASEPDFGDDDTVCVDGTSFSFDELEDTEVSSADAICSEE